MLKSKTSKLRLFIREIIGIYRFIKAKVIYKAKDHPVQKSDFSESKITKKENESFSSFFMRVENVRYENKKRVSKNVASSLTFFSTASQLIPVLTSNCNLIPSSKVLDYGSGGLRCGFGLLDFLDESSYSCADITSQFINEALENSYLLAELFKIKKGKFYEIGQDNIPLDFYDLIISTYVVAHIPKDDLLKYFMKINKYLNKNGFFYFDFWPTPFISLEINSTSFTYPYRLILKILKNSNFKVVATNGYAIIAQKLDK